MKPCEWTPEKEICRIADCYDLSLALRKLALLPDNAEEFSIVADSGWVRGGAETYLFKGEIIPNIGPAIGFIIKACVAFSPCYSADSILKEWVRRRYIVSDAGVSVPKLYGHRDVVLIEECIQYHIRDILSHDNHNDGLLMKLAELAGIIVRLGFAPIELFADLRSRGSDIVMTDFGEDLGPEGRVSAEKSELFTMLLKTLHQQGSEVDADTSRNMQRVFMAFSQDHTIT